MTGGIARASAGRGLLGTAWPVYVELVAGTVSSLVALVWVSRIGPAAVSVVTVAAHLESVLLGVAMVVGGGTTVLLSRALGAGDPGRGRTLLRNSVRAMTVLAVVVLGPLFLARAQVAQVLAGGADVAAVAGFLTVFLPGLIVYFAQHLADSVFKGLGDTRTPMRMAILVNVLLAGLDPVLIFGLAGAPRLGQLGVAVSTALGRSVVLALTGWLLYRRIRELPRSVAGPGTAGSSVPAIVRAGTPMAADFTARMVAALIVVGVVARFGTAELAAFGMVAKFAMFVMLGAYACRQAATILSARAVGAGPTGECVVTGIGRSATRVSAGIAVSSVAGVLSAGPLVGWLTGDAATGAAAVAMGPWLAVYLVLFVVAVVRSGVSFGAGRRGGVLAGLTLLGVGLQAALAPVLSATGLGVRGIWLAMIANASVQCGYVLFTHLSAARTGVQACPAAVSEP